jgi:hypothetical protein
VGGQSSRPCKQWRKRRAYRQLDVKSGFGAAPPHLRVLHVALLLAIQELAAQPAQVDDLRRVEAGSAWSSVDACMRHPLHPTTAHLAGLPRRLGLLCKDRGARRLTRRRRGRGGNNEGGAWLQVGDACVLVRGGNAVPPQAGEPAPVHLHRGGGDAQWKGRGGVVARLPPPPTPPPVHTSPSLEQAAEQP